jgi:hypothetical protein
MKKYSPGDYEVNIVFTYASETEIKQIQSTVNVHIKSIIEQYAALLAFLGLVVAIIGLPQIPIISEYVVNLIFNKRKQQTSKKKEKNN